MQPGNGLSLDPTRLTLKVKDGPAFARAMEDRGIFVEMSDGGHVVLICTCHDDEVTFRWLERALEELRPRMGDCPPLPAPPLPQAVMSPKQALFASRETVPLEQAAGRISACQIAPYPPGVPVIAPGERIEKKYLAYLREMGYNIHSTVEVTV